MQSFNLYRVKNKNPMIERIILILEVSYVLDKKIALLVVICFQTVNSSGPSVIKQRGATTGCI